MSTWHRVRRNGTLLLVLLRLVALLTACGLAAPAPAEEAPGEVTVLRFAESLPAEHPSARLSALFSQLVAEESGGRIEIRVEYGGALGTEAEALEQLGFGGLAFARTSLLAASDVAPLLERYAEAYSYEDADEYMARLQADADFVNQNLDRENLHMLASLYPAQRCIANNLFDVADLESLMSLRIATPSSARLTRFYTSLGIYSVSLKGSGLLRSLGNGFVDGAETTLLEYAGGSYSAMMAFVTMVSGLFSPDLILASNVSLGRLNAADQELIADCAERAYAQHQALLLAAQKEALTELEAAGLQVVDGGALDREIHDALALAA